MKFKIYSGAAALGLLTSSHVHSAQKRLIDPVIHFCGGLAVGAIAGCQYCSKPTASITPEKKISFVHPRTKAVVCEEDTNEKPKQQKPLNLGAR
jgi:hypothetical protein